MKLGETLEVSDRKSWRRWLAKNGKSKTEIWLVYHKKSSGKARISYNDAVEEALCYGWIDSIAKKVDEERFAQRFSPRKPTSGLSEMNRQRVQKLIRTKKMTKIGLAAIAHAFDPSKEKDTALVIPSDIKKALRADKEAWANFQRFPEAYRRLRVAYLDGQRKHGAAQYQRALNHLVKMSAKNKRFGFVKEMR